MAHREIALPLRVRRIALRQAFGDRQARLVGRQRPWPIPLRHQHITNAIERNGYSTLVLSGLRCRFRLLKRLAGAIEITEADEAVPQAKASRRIRWIRCVGLTPVVHLGSHIIALMS